MVDEKIASIEKAQRQQMKEELLKDKDIKQEEIKLTVKKAREGIKTGTLTVMDKQYRFKKKELLNGKIQWFDLVGEWEEQVETTEVGDYAWFFSGISEFMEVYLFYPAQQCIKTTMQEHIDVMKRTFQELGLFIRVEEKKECEQFDYFTYFLASGKGDVFGISFWQKDGDYKCTGSMTCLYQQKDTIGKILEAMVQEIRVMKD